MTRLDHQSERVSSESKENPEDTVRLRRPPPRVYTDQCGRNVWMGEVEVLELELVEAVNTDPYNSADDAHPWRDD